VLTLKFLKFQKITDMEAKLKEKEDAYLNQITSLKEKLEEQIKESLARNDFEQKVQFKIESSSLN
jgi:hypothetical protein